MYYYSLNEYLKERFGEKVYKIALNGGMTCPNRDGTLGTGGCVFCGGAGSGEFSAQADLSVTEQIEQAKLKIKAKTDCKRFIAYFQPFTNTYAPVAYLKKIYTEAINNDEVAVLSIATRPDCLPDEVIDLLARLNKIKPVWVELGLQTIHKQTADYIRRGYELDVYDSAVKRLHNAGIEVITHVIIGLPNESREMILKSARYAGERSEGIKLQLLHVLKGTDLLKDYENGKFEVLSLEEYLDILSDCVEVLPKNVVIHRLTGDGDKKLLVAPEWSGDKKHVLNEMNRVFRERNVVQGSKYNENKAESSM